MHDVFVSGPKRLEQASLTLQQNIQKLKWDKDSPLCHRADDRTLQESRLGSSQLHTNGKKPSSVVFVAHSLGKWVIKSLGPLPEVIGCIFIDARISQTHEDYDRYVSDITNLFASRPIRESKRTKISDFLRKLDNSVHDQESLDREERPNHGDLFQLLESRPVSITIWMSLSLETTYERFSLSYEKTLQMTLELRTSDESATECKRTAELAASFLRMGEFRNAQRLFTILESQIHGLDQSQILEIQLKLAQTFIYTGQYAEALVRLEEINRQAKVIQPGPLAGLYGQIRLRLQIERWLAVSAIRLGHFESAKKRLDELRPFCDCDKIPVSEEFATFRVEVRTDLALAYALSGQYSIANKSLEVAGKALDQLRRAFYDKDSPEHSHIFIASLTFGLERAKVELLQGKYSSVLKIATDLRQEFDKLLGRRHFRIFELTSVVARALTCESQYEDAHSLCDGLVEDMSVELGRSHPLTLAVMENLVQILRSQSRFAEALESAKVILSLTENCLGNKHPQTLLVKSQLAAAHFDVGNYHTAEKLLEGINSTAKQCFGEYSPDSLRYLCLTATVLNKSQESGRAALAYALTTFKNQGGSPQESQLASPDTSIVFQGPTNKPPGHPMPETVSPSIDDSQQASAEKRMIAVLEALAETGGKEEESHPDLLSTLEAISFIVNQHAQELLGGVQPEYILDVVAMRRRTLLGPRHLDTLISEFHLAVITRDSGFSDDGLEYASVALYDIWQRLATKFGPSHPRTLIAERELITTDCMRGKWQLGGPAKRRREWDWQFISRNLIQATPSSSHAGQDYFQPGPNVATLENGQRRDLWELLDIEEVSREVLQLLEPQLGLVHPEVLSALLWLFTVQVHLDSMLRESGSNAIHIDVHETRRDLSERCRNPTVVHERHVEASKLKRRIRMMSDELERESGQLAPIQSPFTYIHQSQDEKD